MSFLTKLGKVITGGGSSAAAPSRSVAKERLSVILASQRGSELLAGVDMEALQKDVLAVVEKHVQIAQNRAVNFNVKNEGEVNLFEMSVELGSHRAATISAQSTKQ
mmetsp:Transcript_2739/g.5902  ORF Transcript_2739/g.5902 Transcript_2739/m.5902 type:complete len:106 (-) Transcript_2739:432-749(-)|eukprot:CAMPEP_0183299566 /NCGR_PEP_ID=MMETSP0160_2-20130417/6269_1 /TAXON_ID=2839 ORGANISM="Odontella Sinensis, Strain Grunow 1884" /NCGR_SAMPLE_ID=MMETSP0160_2 /ASSEMBLY_ACC=CAM_ASM_000250 /LENGTH=105 /DNA_ID=CAMNT_0025461831 /DNA_START=74 /DNA_END=391 /DNA_ORIENTATION=-